MNSSQVYPAIEEILNNKRTPDAIIEIPMPKQPSKEEYELLSKYDKIYNKCANLTLGKLKRFINKCLENYENSNSSGNDKEFIDLKAAMDNMKMRDKAFTDEKDFQFGIDRDRRKYGKLNYYDEFGNKKYRPKNDPALSGGIGDPSIMYFMALIPGGFLIEPAIKGLHYMATTFPTAAVVATSVVGIAAVKNVATKITRRIHINTLPKFLRQRQNDYDKLLRDNPNKLSNTLDTAIDKINKLKKHYELIKGYMYDIKRGRYDILPISQRRIESTRIVARRERGTLAHVR